MNREIKFRAYNKKLKLMSEPWGIFEGFDGECMYSCWVNDEQYLWYPKEVELMQYTGLKDKNGCGQEVYEGDIISSDGKIKGNIYEMDASDTDLVIKDFGGKTWIPTYQEALDRGLGHAKRHANKNELW